MGKNKIVLNKGLNLTLIIALIISIIYGVINISYALMSQEENNITITINENGSYSSDKNLFGQNLWYPGKKVTGTLTINNNYRSMKIEKLGLGISLNNIASGYDYNIAYNSFLTNMKISLKKGTMLVFSDTIVGEKTFGELLWTKDGVHNGYDLDSSNHFTINKGQSLKLDYEVKMDVAATNELEGLEASVDLLLNISSSNEYDPPNPPNPPNPPMLAEEPTDIVGHWSHDCIMTLVEHDIIVGYPDGTIGPDNKITRAEVAVLVGRALEIEQDYSKEPPYKDNIHHWAKGYVTKLTDMKVLKGYPDGEFKPYNNITRQEVAAVLIRAFNKECDNEIELEFKDKNDIHDWAFEYVKIGVENNIITGYPDNTFKPLKVITRGEVFTMLCKLLEYHEEHLVKD